MKKGWFVVFFALLVFVSVGPPASAESDKVALVIGNSNYPDAESPLKQPAADARAIADELRRNGFEVDIGENLTKEATQRALDRLYGKVRSGTSVLLFFSGYGIQTGRQTYLIPVNAQIWAEPDVRRDGAGFDTILAELNARGASVKIGILDASRRNPFERRFRGVSTGLAPVTAPKGTLVISAAAPGAVVNDGDGDSSTFVRELLKEMRSTGLTVEEIFNRTRIGVSRVSKGDQVPWISSSLVEDFYLGKSSQTSDSRRDSDTSRRDSDTSRRDSDTSRRDSDTSRRDSDIKDTNADMRRDYEFADRLGTRKGWEDFLAKYKSGSYVELARDKLAKLDPPSNSSRPNLQLPDTKETKESKPDKTAKVEPTKKEPAEKEKEPLIQELDRIIDQNPDDGDAYFKRGLAHAQKSRYNLAIKDFDQAIRLNPKDAEAYNNRCWARAMIGDLQVALKDCNESLRLKPNFVDALDSRGLVNLKIGLPTNAIADYSAALRVNPKHASALFGRGKAKLQNGDKAGGNADIAAAKAINRDIAQDYEDYGIK